MATQRKRSAGGARPHAFTLIELLVVSSITAALISIMLPSVARVREEARRTVCAANLKGLGIGLFAYAADNLDHGPPVMPPITSRAPRSLLSHAGRPVNLGLLHPAAVADAQAFHCPSQRKFNYSSDLTRLDSATVAGSYAYAVHLPAMETPRFSALRRLAMVADDYVARYGDVGVGRYSHRVGYNVLYTDGSVAWYNDADESIWKRRVYWDDERDEINYQSLYNPAVDIDANEYGRSLDIFRIWHAFCYFRPDTYDQDVPDY